MASGKRCYSDQEFAKIIVKFWNADQLGMNGRKYIITPYGKWLAIVVCPSCIKSRATADFLLNLP